MTRAVKKGDGEQRGGGKEGIQSLKWHSLKCLRVLDLSAG